MSARSNIIRFLFLALGLVISPVAYGQVYHPFAEPMQFNPDYQFFAPIQLQDVEELSLKERGNYGFFGTYDRMNIAFSRPDTEQSSQQWDYTWGNRFDLGFMTEKDSGWLFSFSNVSGPNAYLRNRQYRLNPQNADAAADPLTTPQTIPTFDLNDEFGPDRTYVLRDSLNVGSYTNWEVNKTWRMEPYRYGGIIEPLLGLRFAKFRDQAINDSYADSVNSPLSVIPLIAGDSAEILNTDYTTITNNMFGGQIGFRYMNYFQRWTLSSDVRFMGLQNFQRRNYVNREVFSEYDAIGTGGTIQYQRNTATVESSSNNEFVFAIDVRAEAAYQVTKYISGRVGFQMVDFTGGIWRGANPGLGNINDNNQDLKMAGITFGFTVNR